MSIVTTAAPSGFPSLGDMAKSPEIIDVLRIAGHAHMRNSELGRAIDLRLTMQFDAMLQGNLFTVRLNDILVTGNPGDELVWITVTAHQLGDGEATVPMVAQEMAGHLSRIKPGSYWLEGGKVAIPLSAL